MITNMGLLRNLVSMEGFNSTADDGIRHLSFPDLSPLVSISDEIPRSVTSLSFQPVADFTPSTHGCNSMGMMISEPEQEIQLVNSSPSVTMANRKNQVQNYGGKKRKREGEVEKEKPREVVCVRAKRGQATDNHSLAERLRREKINEKLRCLQDLVPGCYKAMGMAVMLDVTINYVRSLQNQIHFLSTKLYAASLFYDFNSSLAEFMETIQEGTNGYEATQEMEEVVGEAHGERSHLEMANRPF